MAWSPFLTADGTSADTSRRNDSHPTHWLISTQVLAVESDGEGRYLFALASFFTKRPGSLFK